MRAATIRCLGLVVAIVVTSTSCSSSESLEPLEERLAEEIEFESVDLPGRLWDPLFPPVDEGAPVTVTGLLAVPPTDVPLPGVVIVHGCGGVGGAELGWAREIEDAGIATLVIDSFGGRGVANICGGQETLNVASPIVDLYRAVELLESHPYVDASRLVVLGVSFGGRTAIWSAFPRVQDDYGGRPFAGHVAIYPSTCFIRMKDEGDITGPLRILHGDADDWTPIGQCQQMVERMQRDGADAQLHAYADAHHGFDNRSQAASGTTLLARAASPRGCNFVESEGQIIDPETGDVAGVGSPCVEFGVRSAYNPTAHAAARVDLLEFLASVLGPIGDG